MKNLGDYHDLHVLDKFKDTCLKTYHFDLSHFYSAPEKAWIAELITHHRYAVSP